MYKIKSLFILVALIFISCHLNAQTNQSSATMSSNTNNSIKKIETNQAKSSLKDARRISSKDVLMLKKELNKAENIVNLSSGGLNPKVSISGSSRFELRGVYLQNYQASNSIPPLTAGIDPGATKSEPNFFMKFVANPYYNVTLTADLGLYTKFEIPRHINYITANYFLMESFINTDIGNYKLSFGGVWWVLYNSKFTFATGMAGGRTYYFPRFPWAFPDSPLSEYNYAGSYFKWFQPHDAIQRAGSIGLKGFHLSGTGLPWGLSLSLFGGFNDKDYGTLSKLIFWKLSKKLGPVSLSFNGSGHFNNKSFSSTPSEKNTIVAIEEDTKLFGFDVSSEFSLMKEILLESNINTLSYSGYIDLRKTISGRFPVKLLGYYVPENYYSPDTSVISTKKYYSSQSKVYYNILEDNSVFYQNRAGGRFHFGAQLKGLLVGVGYSLSKTLTPTTNIINFPHHLLHFEFFYTYRKDLSLYDAGQLHASEEDGGYDVDYEGGYETVYMQSSTASYKFFNNIDIDAKVKLGDIADFFQYTYVFGDAGIHNIVTKLDSPLSPDILGNTFYDIFLAQGITKNIFVLAFRGQEYFTGYNLAKKISERDTSYGLGLTFNLHKNVLLCLKTRRFEHRDLVVNRKNNFTGYWSNIELKTFF